MFADPWTLQRIIPSGSATSDHNIWIRIAQNGQNTEYRKLDPESASAVQILKIQHSEVGSGSRRRRRSMVGMYAPILDADGVPNGQYAGLHQVADIPFGTADLQGTSLWTHFTGLMLGESNENAHAGDIGAFYSLWLAGMG